MGQSSSDGIAPHRRHLPGGLAIVSLVACALFTAFTGASGVTIVALGALLYPALMQDGYQEKFSLGLVTTSGSLGLLFPPSVPLIIYGVIAQQMGVGQTFAIRIFYPAGGHEPFYRQLPV